MSLVRIFSIFSFAILFCGCTNFQGAKALEFFSHLDKYGRWKNYNRTDFEGRILKGNVACIEAEISALDSAKSKKTFKGYAKKCWDEFGILVEAVIKDSTGTNLYQLKSKTENGYLIDRNINIHLYAQTRLSAGLTYISMTEEDDGGTRNIVYTQKNDSGSVFKVQFPKTPNEKITTAQIKYPFAHELKFSYNDKDELIQISDSKRSKAYRINFTESNQEANETKIIYSGETYSYQLKKTNSQKQPIEEIFSDEFTGKKVHRKYTYTDDGKTATIWENGLSRNIVYENGKFVREEYYDYAESLRQIVEIETDSLGNVIKSTYIPVIQGKMFSNVQKQYNYTIEYR